ncbi:hypothetical protein RHS03_09406, partial [Rhizoctonia solani]
MNSPSVSVQPTAAPRMQMTIEQAQASERQESENLASRTRGGGAVHGVLLRLRCDYCLCVQNDTVSFPSNGTNVSDTKVARARSAVLAVADQMN